MHIDTSQDTLSGITPEMQQFINAHRNNDVRTLALRAPRTPQFDLTTALEQIAGWQTARHKLPSWAMKDGIVYPPHLSMEQCSSEAAARYKAEVAKGLLDSLPPQEGGTRLVDMTGGLGVDFSFLAPLFDTALYNERDGRLCLTARHNLALLGLGRAEVSCDEAAHLLDTMTPATMIFADPARRDSNGGKTVAIAQCSPDVAALRTKMLSRAPLLMIKLSPMLDWHKAVADMGGSVSQVHIVATGGECKDLLIVADRQRHDSVLLTCINDNQRCSFVVTDGTDATQPPLFDTAQLLAGQGESKTIQGENTIIQGENKTIQGNKATQGSQLYLFEPNAAVMKAGCFGQLAARYGLAAVGRNSHLFITTRDPRQHTTLSDGTQGGSTQGGSTQGGSNTAAQGQPLPGRLFAVAGCSTMNRRCLKTLLRGTDRACVAVRNMPLTPDQLRRRLGLKDGGDSYVFGTTAADGTHVILLCKRI